MKYALKFALTTLILCVACTTPMKQDIDLAKLKPQERAYKGNIQIELNDLKNEQLTCDLFLNSDMNPTIRLSPDGDFQFKSIKKELAFSRVACIYTVNNQRRWIYHSLDLPRLKQPTDNKEFYNLGNLSITWNVDDSVFEKETSVTFGSEDKMRDIGDIEIKPSGTAKPPSPQL